MIEQKFSNEINDIDGVKAFFRWLHETALVAFDPADTFLNYINTDTGAQTFDENDCERYDLLMDKCQEICDGLCVDIYEIANEISFPWMIENNE